MGWHYSYFYYYSMVVYTDRRNSCSGWHSWCVSASRDSTSCSVSVDDDSRRKSSDRRRYHIEVWWNLVTSSERQPIGWCRWAARSITGIDNWYRSVCPRQAPVTTLILYYSTQISLLWTVSTCRNSTRVGLDKQNDTLVVASSGAAFHEQSTCNQ